MIIRSVDATWLSVPIPLERQHVSDFGRITSFDMALVRIETEPVDISPEEMQFIIDHGSSLLSESFYGMLVEKCATTLLPLIR